MSIPFRLASLLALALVLVAARVERPADASEEARTERWYERLMRGDKAGHLHVTWSPSIWEGKPAIHDRTVMTMSSTRSMAGHEDRFDTTIQIDLDRGRDGLLFFQRIVVKEAGRETVEETTWHGDRYTQVTQLGDEVRTIEVPLPAPVMTDSESFLVGRLIAGDSLEAGKRFRFHLLDMRARKADPVELEILAAEEVPDAGGGRVKTWKVAERHLASGSESTLWVDEVGALVRHLGEDGTEIRRVDRSVAEAAPVRPATYEITVKAEPHLERVFGADAMHVEMRLAPDPARKVPTLPDSPWSRVVSVKGDDEKGWTLALELSRYAGTGRSDPLPLQTKGFERELEATVLMPVTHPRLVEQARSIVGDAQDAREAVRRLSRWVYLNLNKMSPEVAQASALEILDSCQGDCSEHALLYVTLARAAGIPTRACTGYVCVGSLWGGHAWAESYVGEWIGVDPTTGEVGPGARFILFGYPDREDSFPQLVSSRIAGRMRLVSTRVEEGDAAYDLRSPAGHRLEDEARRRFLNVLCGLEAIDVPADWSVGMPGDSRMILRTPRLRVDMVAMADQGMDIAERSGHAGSVLTTQFGGAPTLMMHVGDAMAVYETFSRGRLVRTLIQAADGGKVSPGDVAQIEYVLAPTFAPRALAWAPPESTEPLEEVEKEPAAGGVAAPR